MEQCADLLRQSWRDGVGELIVQPINYDTEYFERYQDMDQTDMGARLTDARVAMVLRHADSFSRNVDVGIGGGRFVFDLARTDIASFGHDINHDAIDWLKDRNGHLDPFEDHCAVQSMTFWDSLEHMTRVDAEEILQHADKWAFVSMPIYQDVEDAIKSKHFKPGEHILYFTRAGLISFMKDNGFILFEYNDAETVIGREGIESFAFRRVKR